MLYEVITVLKRECTPDRSWGWVTRFGRTFENHRAGFGADGNYQGDGGTENTFIKEGYFKSAPTDGDDEWDASRWQGVYIDDQWTVSRYLDLYFGLRVITSYSIHYTKLYDRDVTSA